MSPQGVAFLGLVYLWTMPPALAACLWCVPGRTRLFSRGLALVLLLPWGVLILAAPRLLSALL